MYGSVNYYWPAYRLGQESSITTNWPLQGSEPAKWPCVKCVTPSGGIKYDAKTNLLLSKCSTCGFTNQFQPADKPTEKCNSQHFNFQYENQIAELSSRIRKLEDRKRWWRA